MTAPAAPAPAPNDPARRDYLARKALGLDALSYRKHADRLTDRDRAYSDAVRHGERRP